jgi:outer membrane protein OmpA-like peptidoglycan-associated protein
MNFKLTIVFVFTAIVLKSQDTISVFFENNAYTTLQPINFEPFLGENIVSVEIISYCDDVGSENYNLKLSQKRADFISNIVAEKIPENKITAIGKGELKPSSKINLHF